MNKFAENEKLVREMHPELFSEDADKRSELVRAHNPDLYQGKAVSYDGQLYDTHKSQNWIYERYEKNAAQIINRGFKGVSNVDADFDYDDFMAIRGDIN